MNVLYIRTFKDPQLLEEMLALRREGWSITALAQKYNCNFTSVWHQCKKHDIRPLRITIRLTQTPQNPVYEDFNGETLNKGKSYKEYLKEEEERRRIKFALFLEQKRLEQKAMQKDKQKEAYT